MSFEAEDSWRRLRLAGLETKVPADFTKGKLLGDVADDEVLLVQVGSEVLAIDPYCSH